MRLTGESAGGNLAAAVTLKLRDDNFEPAVKMQLLFYPWLQVLDLQLPSYIRYQHGALLTQKAMAFFLANTLDGSDRRQEAYRNNDHVSPAVKKMTVPYIDVSQLPSKYLVGYENPSVETGNKTMWTELKDKLLSPYLSPLVADRLDGLPLTFILSAEQDVLRDDSFLYAARLRKSGVSVEHVHSEVSIHASLNAFGSLPEVEEIYQDVAKFITSNL